MKKRVNGKVIDIDNIEIFEKGIEGSVVNREAVSNISDIKSIKKFNIEIYIKIYNSFYRALPFPLYCLDSDIKYATIGNYIKFILKNMAGDIWVNDGLYIALDTNIALLFINNTWAIVSINKYIDRKGIEFENYYKDLGFRDYKWVFDCIVNKKDTSKYYDVFMPEFVGACNKQEMLLKWELSNILTFGSIPDRQEYKENKILDLENNEEYTLDIFITGKRKNKNSIVINLTNSSYEELINKYNFDIYKKSILALDSEIPNKIKKCELHGAANVFMSLYAYKRVYETTEFPTYKGLIGNGHIIYEVDNKIFVAKAYKYVESVEIARGVELYAYDKGMVYIVKKNDIAQGIKQNKIYSYSLNDKSLRLCKIEYKHE